MTMSAASMGHVIKPGTRGGSARVPVAEASPCAPKKGRAVAASKPPGGERSVCGMSGRQIAIAPRLFAEFICVTHTDMSAPRKTVFLADIKTTAQKVANGDAVHYPEADVRLARGRGGGETPPAPNTAGFKCFAAEMLPVSSRHIGRKIQKKLQKSMEIYSKTPQNATERRFPAVATGRGRRRLLSLAR